MYVTARYGIETGRLQKTWVALSLLGYVLGKDKKNKNLCYKDLARFLRNDLFLAAYFWSFVNI